MLKLILSLVLIVSSLFIGQSMSSRLYRRKDVLTLFIDNIHTSITKLEYSAETVYELFEDFSFERDKPFLPQWDSILSEYKNALNKKDLSLLKDFARGLGDTDTQSQIKHMRYYLSLLEVQLTSAQNDINQKSKLYRGLGFSAGVTLSLLLI
ncbi:MAG: stage III sporulation protein AB [Ruminococcus sp.]|nr:stage III sporulation protein AB [Ruminococcus sp.]